LAEVRHVRRQVRRRLDDHGGSVSVAGSIGVMTMTEAIADFVISRVLDAPRDLVWKCFTDPEHMKQWWGPKGFTVVKSEMDLRPGGTYLYALQPPGGAVMWGKFTYREIVPPTKLVFITCFSDENAGITRHPMAPTWPLESMSTFTFDEVPGGKTKFTV